MKTTELKEIVALIKLFHPTMYRGSKPLTESEVAEIQKQSNDNRGEFRVNLKPSECLRMMQVARVLKARIEEAELFGGKEV